MAPPDADDSEQVRNTTCSDRLQLSSKDFIVRLRLDGQKFVKYSEEGDIIGGEDMSISKVSRIPIVDNLKFKGFILGGCLYDELKLVHARFLQKCIIEDCSNRMVLRCNSASHEDIKRLQSGEPVCKGVRAVERLTQTSAPSAKVRLVPGKNKVNLGGVYSRRR